MATSVIKIEHTNTRSLTLNDTYCQNLGTQSVTIVGKMAFLHVAFSARIDIPISTTIATLPSGYVYQSYENIAVITKNGLVRTFQIRNRNLQNGLAIDQGDVVQLSGAVALA